MRWLRVVNRVAMWFLIVIPVLGSGVRNLREQLGYGVARRWDSWSDVAMGWGLWIVGVFIWIAIIRGVAGWIDRKLGGSPA